MNDHKRKGKNIRSGVALIIVLTAILGGCSSKEATTTISPEQRFESARALFDNGDYLEAINEFNIITVQYQGSAVAGEAQYYLAECRYKREEFLLASYEYQTLRRNMPASPRVPDAMYKLGMCFYNLSPKSRLDQQYTKRAIEELQAFVEYYPKNEHAADAAEKIQELNNRLAKKEFDTAQLYATMDYYKSAIVYYDNVIEKYHDTDYAPLAYLSKTELLISRKKFSEAKAVIMTFIDKYPNSVLRGRADKLNQSIEAELQSATSAKGQSGSTLHSGSEAHLLRTN